MSSNLADEPSFVNVPLSIEHRYLEYHYTKQIYRSSPVELSSNLADEPSFVNVPLSIEHRYLEYHYTKQIYRSSPVNQA